MKETENIINNNNRIKTNRHVITGGKFRQNDYSQLA